MVKSICWMGVAADALWAVALIHPKFYGVLTGKLQAPPDLDQRLVMGIAASLMAGWTLLLAWTAAKPVERRTVMLLTAVPVIAGLTIVTAIGMVNGHAANHWIMGKCLFLLISMLAGVHMAKGAKNEVDH
jgi:peptidoglycan/LPS O-acetylase OafA/YrhL